MPPPTELFSTAEARAFAGARLASETDYPTVDITAKEVEIRAFLAKACSVDFIPTTHVETYDGDGSDYLALRWPKVSEVTGITIDGVAVDSALLNPLDYGSGLAIDSERGIITSRSFKFTAGWSNIVVTYVAGYDPVPDTIKRAALRICVLEMPTTNVPFTAESYDAGGMSVNFANGDGFNGHWHRDPDVMKAIRLYDHNLPGVA